MTLEQLKKWLDTEPDRMIERRIEAFTDEMSQAELAWFDEASKGIADREQVLLLAMNPQTCPNSSITTL